MQDDLEVVIEGRRASLRNVGDELWANDICVQAASIVVRRHEGQWSADVGNGSSSCRDSAQSAVDAAQIDSANRVRRPHAMPLGVTEAA